MKRILLTTLLVVSAFVSIAAPLYAFPERIVAFGDSMTFGVGATSTATWPNLLRKSTGAYVNSIARSGWTTAALAENPKTWTDLLGSNPLYRKKVGVVVMLGTNDWGLNRTLEQFRSDYRTLMQAVSGSESILCITPPSRFEEVAGISRAGGSLEEFRQAIREECLGEVLEGPIICPWGAAPDNANFSDFIHPSNAGHALIADAVRNAKSWK